MECSATTGMKQAFMFFWNYLSLKMTAYNVENYFLHPIHFLNDQLTTEGFIYWGGVSIRTHDQLLIEQQEHHSLPFFFYTDWFFFLFSAGNLAILFLPKSIAHFFENIRTGVPTSINFSYSRIKYFPTGQVFRRVSDSIRIILHFFYPHICHLYYQAF